MKNLNFILFFNFKVSPFKTWSKNVHSNLKLEEIAFLCNMSLSTKRHFIVEYNEAPGKWLQDKLFKSKRDSKGRSLKLQIFIKTWATTIFLTSV
jgi:hypothetical protein